MLWSEVRELFPNQFVLVQALKSHQDGNKLYVDEMAVIRPIPDPHEATRELLKSKNENFVYHTGKTKMVMEIVSRVGFRRSPVEDSSN
ncbi:hypothetical protein [Ferroacidibacillus organovorans]|uniref:Uncharacterized protein n=1 Tax=Ferroacidibacillus organovorans TaxID=1765683 RepID=A0A1V4EVR1_9BACL|nr:hypothetical protein [Ferroacidibacillus organovorans]OPG16942.1 hypothetical protein B2M26_04265 [Ferroacidibacillus organovorans]